MKEEKPKHTHKRKQQQKNPQTKENNNHQKPHNKTKQPQTNAKQHSPFFLQAHYKEYQPENRYRHALFISPSALGFSFLG